MTAQTLCIRLIAPPAGPRVSAQTTNFGVGETNPTGLVWHNGQLYMTGSVTDGLHTLDTATGVAALITSSGPDDDDLSGVASHNGELYVTTRNTDPDTDTDTGRF